VRCACTIGRHDLAFLTASQQLQLSGSAGLESSMSCGTASPPIGSPLASMRASAAGLDMTGEQSVYNKKKQRLHCASPVFLCMYASMHGRGLVNVQLGLSFSHSMVTAMQLQPCW
jgi:hypothetical protein